MDVRNNTTGEAKVELIFKYPELDIETLQQYKRDVKVGDVVQILSWIEKLPTGSILYHGTSLKVKQKLQQENTFIPERPIVQKSKSGVCKYWINTGTCQLGSNCPFKHERDEMVQKKWVSERIEHRASLHSQSIRSDHNQSHENPISNCQRAGLFADFLLKIYGQDYLNENYGVIDIAGGRGGVSYELWCKHNIKCTLVEPRKQKLSKKQHKWLKKNEKISIGQDVESALCPHLAVLFDQDSQNTYKEIFSNSSILIGMHPDEATQPILEYALAHDKPFAIVPCCVFPNLFPRSLENGKQVVEYDDFVTWCLETAKKASDANKWNVVSTTLGFLGRDIVIYRASKEKSESV
eukprot:TRINITY_DN24040_c0_g1_i1.p1 TRINITY_DN24040_c0_g1~~TRINITY_DN24040_c0_g1_i1.p1  ORF type:complete len:351 (+),score=53.81 TRINITY_DN24040_c0_g1_i1:33-1085(+)